MLRTLSDSVTSICRIEGRLQPFVPSLAPVGERVVHARTMIAFKGSTRP